MRIECPDWRPDPNATDHGRCVLGWYGGRPSFGTCQRCLAGGRTGEGLGDTVAKAIHRATGGLVKPCRGCNERRRALNRIAPRRKAAP